MTSYANILTGQYGSANKLHGREWLCQIMTVQSGVAISLCMNLIGLGGSQSGAGLIT